MSEPSAELGALTPRCKEYAPLPARSRPVQFRANEAVRDVFAIAPLLPV